MRRYAGVVVPAIPISEVISRCHRADCTSITAATSAHPTSKIALSTYRTRSDGLGIGMRDRTHRRNTHSSTQPSPYPIAALIPLISPWNSQSRGTSEGVTDSPKNSVASTNPT